MDNDVLILGEALIAKDCLGAYEALARTQPAARALARVCAARRAARAGAWARYPAVRAGAPAEQRRIHACLLELGALTEAVLAWRAGVAPLDTLLPLFAALQRSIESVETRSVASALHAKRGALLAALAQQGALRQAVRGARRLLCDALRAFEDAPSPDRFRAILAESRLYHKHIASDHTNELRDWRARHAVLAPLTVHKCNHELWNIAMNDVLVWHGCGSETGGHYRLVRYKTRLMVCSGCNDSIDIFSVTSGALSRVGRVRVGGGTVRALAWLTPAHFVAALSDGRVLVFLAGLATPVWARQTHGTTVTALKTTACACGRLAILTSSSDRKVVRQTVATRGEGPRARGLLCGASPPRGARRSALRNSDIVDLNSESEAEAEVPLQEHLWKAGDDPLLHACNTYMGVDEELRKGAQEAPRALRLQNLDAEHPAILSIARREPMTAPQAILLLHQAWDQGRSHAARGDSIHENKAASTSFRQGISDPKKGHTNTNHENNDNARREVQAAVPGSNNSPKNETPVLHTDMESPIPVDAKLKGHPKITLDMIIESKTLEHRIIDLCVHGNTVVCATVDSQLWALERPGCARLGTPRLLLRLPAHIYSLSIGTFNRLIIANVVSRESTIMVCDLHGRVKARLGGHRQTRFILRPCFSKSEAEVLCGSECGALFVWNLAGALLHRFASHTNTLTQVITDGPPTTHDLITTNTYYTVSDDGSVKKWTQQLCRVN